MLTPVLPYLLLRFVKLVGVALLFAGTIGAFLPERLRDRQRAGHLLAGPAFLVTWGSGFALAYLQHSNLFSYWILGSMGLSFFSLNVVLFCVAQEGRRSIAAAALALASLLGALALMVWRF